MENNRKKIRKKRPVLYEQVSISLPKTLASDLRARREKTGLPISRMVQEAVKLYVLA